MTTVFQAGHADSRTEHQFIFLKMHMFLKLKSMSHNVSQGGIYSALHAEHNIK